MSILINPTKRPTERRHICWNVRDDNSCLILDEIVECFYEHPESDGVALIPKIEIIERNRVMKNTKEATPLFILQNALSNINLTKKG